MSKSESLKKVLVIISTIGIIFVNWMAAMGNIGGITPDVISSKYPTVITPAGYTFSIWGIIYLGLIAFSIFQALPSNTNVFRQIRSPYIFSCVANCGWIYLWHHEMIVLSVFVILLLLASLALIGFNLRDESSIGENLFAKLPFGVYFGWVTAATFINITIALLYLGFNASETVSLALGCFIILLTAIVGVIMRERLTNSGYPLALAWAYTGIAVKQGPHTAIVIFCALGVIVSLFSALSFVLKEPSKN
jgi:hypothetical protein